MLFLTLMEGFSGRATDQPGTLKRIRSMTPPVGIKIHEIYLLFGRYDGAILFEAPDLRAAKDFILRAATSIYKTETLAALPAEELRQVKGARAGLHGQSDKITFLRLFLQKN